MKQKPFPKWVVTASNTLAVIGFLLAVYGYFKGDMLTLVFGAWLDITHTIERAIDRLMIEWRPTNDHT